MALILITHDLGVVAEMADEVIVMYAGRMVEKAPVKDIFASPRHPYTRGLLRGVPVLSADSSACAKKRRLETIPGIVPSLSELPKGCRFQDRCAHVGDDCRKLEPDSRKITDAHEVRCFRDLS